MSFVHLFPRKWTGPASTQDRKGMEVVRGKLRLSANPSPYGPFRPSLTLPPETEIVAALARKGDPLPDKTHPIPMASA